VTDDHDLEGRDPYDLMEAERNRLERYFAGLGAEAWTRPSRCEGWTVRDVLAHLAASEAYNRACLDGTVAEFLARMGERGVTDLDGANELGIRDLDSVPTDELVSAWVSQAASNHADFRRRDGSDVDSSVGAYPARWQAWHLAFELAIHADDVGVPVRAAEEPARTQWQAAFARFALKEVKPDVSTQALNGHTRVRGQHVDVELADDELVQAAAGRSGDTSTLDADARALLRVT
jgi:uncharacterized protein (TIGR03083 family)